MNHINARSEYHKKLAGLTTQVECLRKINGKPVVRFFPDHGTNSPFWNTLDSDQGLDFYNFPLDMFKLDPMIIDAINSWVKAYETFRNDEDATEEWKKLGVMIYQSIKCSNPDFNFVYWV